MAHIHSIYDTDSHFIIDSKTQIIDNTSGKISIIQGDHNSERFTFELPRFIDGHDMSLCSKVEVHYLNVGANEKKAGVYEVDDLQVYPDDENIVICSWLISRNATQLAGTLNFVVKFFCLTDGKVDYSWSTAIYSGIKISNGIHNSEIIAKDYPDILARWKEQLLKAASVTHSWDGTVLTITSSSGTSSADLKGAPGVGAAVMQTTGDSETAVMSQKAATNYVKEYIPKIPTRNLLKGTFEHALIDTSTGDIAITNSQNYAVNKEFIPVVGGENYIFSWESKSGPLNIRVHQYTEGKAYLTLVDKYTFANGTYTTVTLDAACVYVRIELYSGANTLWTELLPIKFQMEAGAIITPYVLPEIIDPRFMQEIAQTTGDSETAVMSQKAVSERLERIVVNRNLFTDQELIKGYTYSFLNGLGASATYNYFKNITLQPGTYMVTPKVRFISDMTAKKDIVTKQTNNATFTVESESVYRITVFAADSDYKLFSTEYTQTEVEALGSATLNPNLNIPKSSTESQYYTNMLTGKKWYACGDSFTADGYGTTDQPKFTEGLYAGRNKVYPYFIGNRCGMDVYNIAAGGKTLAYVENYNNCFADTQYTTIPEDADYITMYFGINDAHQSVPIGEVDDADNTTFCGAWNVVLEHLITNHPFAHIGIIVSNGTSEAYVTATKQMATKWGIPYLDLATDDQVPLLLRTNRTNVCATAKNLRLEAFRVSDTNSHPNAECHEYESYCIESWLMRI